MASQVDYCNAALLMLAQDRAIASMGEQTKDARVFTRVYDRVRDLVLAEHDWPFALSAQALAPSAEAPLPGWGYRYAVPAECLRLVAVTGERGVRGLLAGASDGRMAFETCSGAQETDLVTDQAEAYALYVQRVTDTGRYPPLFGQALSCRLAIEVAPALAGELGLRLAQKLTQDYEIAAAKAIALGHGQSHETQFPVTPSVAARA